MSKLPSSTHFQRLLIGALVSCPGRPELLTRCHDLGIYDRHFQASELILWREIHQADIQLRPFDFNALSNHLRSTRNSAGDVLANILGDCVVTNGIPEAIPQYCKDLIEIQDRRDALYAMQDLEQAIEQGDRNWRDKLEKVESLKENCAAGVPPRPLVDFSDTPPDASKTLLGNRFLCTEGGMLFVGPSGIGKTTASVQQDLLWSVGQPAFGITPAKPLKILTIQAEDDDGDLSEIVSGVKDGVRLTPGQCQQTRGNCFYVVEKSHTGIEFLEKIVRPLLKKHRPDLLRINPLHAYLGGDVKDTALTASFLRNHLNPLLQEFQCGCIIVHHTPKVTFRDTKEWKASDWMYAGAGAADITNWCRAALIIDPTTNPRVFRFIAAKRASRIGWEDDITGEREYIRHFAHDDNGSIYWREADEKEVETTQAGGDQQKEEKILDLIPPLPLELFRPEIVELAKDKYDFGEHLTRRIASILIEKGTLEVIKKPRSGTKPAEFLRRTG